MRHTLLWTPVAGADGAEWLRLTERPDGLAAQGELLGIAHALPFRLAYTLWLSYGWWTRTASFALDGAPPLVLRASRPGSWADRRGQPVADLEGCADLDISGSGFTNTLAIRRLRLEPGGTATISAAFLDLALGDAGLSLVTRSVPQRYTCLAVGATGGRYRYESLASGFQAELTTDADGLILEYAGVLRQRAAQ